MQDLLVLWKRERISRASYVIHYYKYVFIYAVFFIAIVNYPFFTVSHQPGYIRFKHSLLIPTYQQLVLYTVIIILHCLLLFFDFCFLRRNCERNFILFSLKQQIVDCRENIQIFFDILTRTRFNSTVLFYTHNSYS